MNAEETTLPVEEAKPKQDIGNLVVLRGGCCPGCGSSLRSCSSRGRSSRPASFRPDLWKERCSSGDHFVDELASATKPKLPMTPLHVRLWRDPHRQQIISVFRAPLPGTPDYIKRLIGLPGDQLEIREGVVSINGKPLRTEPYRADPPNPTGQLRSGDHIPDRA